MHFKAHVKEQQFTAEHLSYFLTRVSLLFPVPTMVNHSTQNPHSVKQTILCEAYNCTIITVFLSGFFLPVVNLKRPSPAHLKIHRIIFLAY